ncbi:MAG: DUF6527 family protein [Pyrinomonadaceae bacterium]
MLKHLILVALEPCRRLWHKFLYRKNFKCVAVDEIPETLLARKLYIIGLDEPWSAALLCPCGCYATIHLSFLQCDSPSWRLSYDENNQLNLAPSIHRTNGCCAHFFLRNGSIIWCS